jgi:hypothetical protein
MPQLTTKPVRRARRVHRAQIVAEAVVSAYLNDITPAAQRPREGARVAPRCSEASPRASARSPLAKRVRPRHSFSPARVGVAATLSAGASRHQHSRS